MFAQASQLLAPIGYTSFGALTTTLINARCEIRSKPAEVAKRALAHATLASFYPAVGIGLWKGGNYAWSLIPNGTAAAIKGAVISAAQTSAAWVAAAAAKASAGYLALPLAAQIGIPVLAVAAIVAFVAVPRIIEWAKCRNEVKEEEEEVAVETENAEKPEAQEPEVQESVDSK